MYIPTPRTNKPLGESYVSFKTSASRPGDYLRAISDKQFVKMSRPLRNMDNGLIGVALVIKDKHGPHFVFHYPPRPSTEESNKKAEFGVDFDDDLPEDRESTDSEDSDLEDESYSALKAMHKLELSAQKSQGKDHVEELEGDEHYDHKGKHIVPWEHLFEFTTADLESILTPARAYHKKKFELSLDPLTYVSYPIHNREDGSWKKKKKKSKKSADQAEADEQGGLTMFNVVFIMNPSRLEADELITEMFEHVIKTFNKALNHAQASSGYVWKESEMILGMKEKARDERRPMSWLWSEILLRSTLAAAMRDIYNSISKNAIATVRLGSNPPLDLSVQIPVPSFLMTYPNAADRAMLGLPLTSATPFVMEDGEEGQSHINKHFALLLLDDEAKITAEIQADHNDLSAALIETIRLCKPTLSLSQVAKENSVGLNDLLVLAQHLIYWRKAMAVPPLHGRDLYIVNPNCDSRKLPVASVAWKKAFPLAPPLASFLSTISNAPRPYKSFAPSKNHRPTYLDMLAWLMRGGWVTGLRAYAWILVWPEIVYEVEYALKAAEIEKAKNGGKSQSASSESNESTDESGPEKLYDPTAPLTTEQAAEKARLERLAEKVAKEAAAEAAEFAKMPVPVATDHVSVNHAEHLKKMTPYIIVDPYKASHEESLYIAAIHKRITDPKAKDNWIHFTKYFNGEEALESIPLIENMKRKEAWGMLLNYQEHLLICRHW